ncbi:hypothetical protein BKA65DRAFT_596594 [Rhexocercosporidium sp. MPI-PUGE-AT-0058]|nr:hypothetical protein BKA65DRAFT_596594 [Rhexocercosporidium sp. MPI-PUGE-AT-0058]
MDPYSQHHWDLPEEEEDDDEGDSEVQRVVAEDEDPTTVSRGQTHHNKHSQHKRADGYTEAAQLPASREYGTFSQETGSHAFQGHHETTRTTFTDLEASSSRSPKTRRSMQHLPSTDSRHRSSGKHQKSNSNDLSTLERSRSDETYATMPMSPAEPSASFSVPLTTLDNRLENELRIENKRLKAQLRAIQGERLSALDNFQPCTDSDLREAFVQLQHQVSSFSRQLKTALLKSKKQSTVLDGQLLSAYTTDDIPIKFLAESFLWRQLYMECFQTPFILFGFEKTIMSQAWGTIFGDGPGSIPRPTESSERWRSITAKEMLDKITPIKKGERVKEITDSILSRFIYTDYELHTILAKGDQLERLVRKGWDAAAIFAQQRSRVQLTTPDTFEHLEGDWVDVFQEVHYTERAAFAVSPSLVKYGTGYGQNFDAWLCIVKAKAIRIRDD